MPMTTTPDVLPESFVKKLLDEFGVQWTQILILTGVVLSSFSLEPFINPAVWILGIVAAFGIAYLFRREISDRFALVALISFLAAALLVAVPLVLAASSDDGLNATIKRNRDLATLYLALAVGLPLGVSMLSYRKQEGERRSELPLPLKEAASRGVIDADFFHERVDYEIELTHLSGTPEAVEMRYRVRMVLRNRTSRSALYEDLFDPAGEDSEFLHVMVAGRGVDPLDPDRKTARGLRLSTAVEAGGSLEVVVEARSRYHLRDSELIGVYLPCVEMSILLKRPPASLITNFQSLLPEKVEVASLSNGDVLFEWKRGVLPFQGARLFWDKRQPAVRDQRGSEQ